MEDGRIGNEFWKNRLDMSSDGRKLSVEDVTKKLIEYIERCVNESIEQEDFVGPMAKKITRKHMITMSIYGACVVLGITYQTWTEWRKDEKYSDVIKKAEVIFKARNIEGAAAGMLNQSIVSRLEGLVEKQDPDAKPVIEQTNVIYFNGKEVHI